MAIIFIDMDANWNAIRPIKGGMYILVCYIEPAHHPITPDIIMPHCIMPLMLTVSLAGITVCAVTI